jgi:hypothetical protein
MMSDGNIEKQPLKSFTVPQTGLSITILDQNNCEVSDASTTFEINVKDLESLLGGYFNIGILSVWTIMQAVKDPNSIPIIILNPELN